MKHNNNTMTYSNLPYQPSSYPKFPSAILRSCSDTDFQKSIPVNKTSFEDQTENYELEKPIGNPKHLTSKAINAKLFTKGKTKLSQFIQNYSDNLKLIGNRRYNEYHPYQFVKDQRESLPISKIGLFPVPIKSHRKINSNEELYHYKNIQRAVVMMRRMQYKTQINEELLMKDSKTHVNLRKIMLLQRWWKLMYQIIKIQRYWKKKLHNKELQINYRFNKFMENFEGFLRKNLLKEYFPRLQYYQLPEKPIMNYFMLTKIFVRIQGGDVEKVIRIQSYYRTMKPRRQWKKYLELHKYDRPLIGKGNSWHYYTKTKRKSKLNKVIAIGLINRLIKNIRKYQLTQKRIKRQLLFPVVSFKTNIRLPNIQTNILIENMRIYTQKQMISIGPYTYEDMKRLKQSKENTTFMSKTYKKKDKNLKTKGKKDPFNDPIIIPFDANEKNIYYITKERQVDYSNAIIRIQKQVKDRLIFPRHQQWSNLPCYIDKTYITIQIQNYIEFCHKMTHSMQLITFKKRTVPLKSKRILFNKSYHNDSEKYDDNELDHIMFVQQEYKQRSMKENTAQSSQMTNIIKSACFVSKKRKYGYDNAIIRLQKVTKEQQKIPDAFTIPSKGQSFISKKYTKNYDKKIIGLQAKIRDYHNKNCFYTNDEIIRTFNKTRSAITYKEMRDCYQNIAPKIQKNDCYLSMQRIIRSKLKILKCRNIILRFYTKALTTINKYIFAKPHVCQSMITKKRFEDYLLHGMKNLYDDIERNKKNVVSKQGIINIPCKKTFVFPKEKKQIQIVTQLAIINKVIKKSEMRLVTLLPKSITKEIKLAQKPQWKHKPCLRNSLITKTHYKNVTKSITQIETLQIVIKEKINDPDNESSQLNKLRSKSKPINNAARRPLHTIHQSFITKKRKTEYLPQILNIQKQLVLLKQKQIEQNIIKALLKQQKALIVVKPMIIRPILSTRSFMIKIHRKLSKNILFAKLIQLFATKNSQQYVFEKLKYNEEEPTFKYPFYLNTIQRHIKFIKSYACKEDTKIKSRLMRLFPKTTTSIDILEQLLGFNQENKSALKKDLCVCLCSLINRPPGEDNNVFDDCSLEHQTLDHFNNFCSYERNNYNPNDLLARLKQIKLNNTSIFGLTHLVDEEYINKEKGITYCKKCFYYPDPRCKCGLLKKKGINDNDDDLFEMKQLPLEDFPVRDSVHSFQWTQEANNKGVVIRSKPKIDEGFESSITEMLFKGMTMKNGQYKQPEEKTISLSASASIRNEQIYKQSKEIRSAKPMKKIEKTKPIIMLRDSSPFEDGKL